MGIILETKACCLRYSAGTPFEKEALHEVSIAVEEGELLGVIGHTGSGKSTLVQLLCGLLRPESGRVLLAGRDIWAEPKKIRQVRFRVGLVFQYPEYQLFEETVAKDIAFGPRNMGLPEDEVRDRVQRAAEWVGLPSDLLGKSPFELSGGEKRRAAIAGVLAMQPQVLILDEPTAGLDPRGRDRMLQLIQRYRRENGTTVLLVSHSMEDVARVADRVLVMQKGRAALLEPVSHVFSRAGELAQMGLSVPAVTQIGEALRAHGVPLPDSLYTLDDAVAALLPLLKGGDARVV